MSDTDNRGEPNPFSDVIERMEAGAKNALDIMQKGRLGAPYRAPYEVEATRDVFRLRNYHPEEGSPDAPTVLMVPPLMVTSEIYDISPELSAVSFLAARGLDVWLVDFGSPTADEDGLERTLDDHILAVDQAIDMVVDERGTNVHLAGYSQGGMFCYQAAAYRRSKDIESLVTFGSPVDIRRNLPVEMHDDVAERILRAVHRGLSGPLKKLEGLPGELTSSGFKLLNPAKEVKHLLGFFGSLHDRETLEDLEPKRRFLGGEGFVAWPGEALRDFIDEVIVDNRMTSGGFVVADRTVSLADIDAPILYFFGERDELARPPAIKAIEDAAPDASTRGLEIPAGHFGMVVGSTAMERVWPTVTEWVDWHHDDKPTGKLELTQPESGVESSGETALQRRGDDSGTRALYDIATNLVDGLWHRLGDVSREVGGVIDTLRWQIPRFARIESLEDQGRVNIGQALEEQARAIPEETFFLWEGRAYSYADADRRVDALTAVLLEAGVEPGDHVGVLMDNHPDFLTSVGAASRLGAVSVLLNSGVTGLSLEQAIETGDVDFLLTDPVHLDDATDAFSPAKVGVFGLDAAHEDRPGGYLDLDARLTEDVTLPEDHDRNPGRPDDLAMLIFTSGTTGLPKAAKIKNRRWALAALGTAAACEITPQDTVYCVLPLYHATGMLVACGGALVGGARLALAEDFSPERFWTQVRRYGATVVFYVGELCRYLVNAPQKPEESNHPVRLFVGNGLRPDVWRKLLDRFGPVDVLEFYGSTEGNV